MIGTILFVLQIIGKVILFALLFIVVLLLLLLFYPITYRVSGSLPQSKEEGMLSGLSAFSASGKAIWLLGLVGARFGFDTKDGFKPVVKVLGIKLYPREKGDKKEKKKRIKKEEIKPQKPKTEEVKSKENEIKETETKIIETEAKEAKTIEAKATETKTTETVIKDIKPKEPKSNEANAVAAKVHKTETAKERKVSIFEKIKAAYDYTLSLPGKIKYTLSAFCDKILNTKEAVRQKAELLLSFEGRAAVQRLLKYLRLALGHMGFKKGQARIYYGFADPGMTGDILALYSAFYPYIGKRIELYSDFEDEHLYGDFAYKGRIMLGVLIYFIIRILRDKGIMKLKAELFD